MDNKFDYSQSELEMNRVMKMQQEHLQDVTSQVNKDAAQLDELQAKLERILKKRNVTIDEEQLRQKLATDEIDTPEELALVRIEDTVDWDTLVAKSTQRYSKNGPVTLDNLLTQNEIRYGMAEIESMPLSPRTQVSRSRTWDSLPQPSPFSRHAGSYCRRCSLSQQRVPPLLPRL